MEFINTHFDRVSPKPFLVWLTVSFFVWAVSCIGFNVDFIFANATYLNVTYGAVICTIIMIISCISLPFSKVPDEYFKKAHSLSSLFSDTALGASGFLFVAGLYNGALEAVFYLFLGVTLYVLIGNHIYHSIFNENKGSRRFFKKVDQDSNTRIGTGKIERDIEKTVLSFAAFVVLLMSCALVYVFAQVHA